MHFSGSKMWLSCDIQVNQVAKGVISSFDILADLLGSIEHFVDRLNIYTRIPPTPALDKIVVKSIVELISTLAWVTRKLEKRRLREYFSSLTFVLQVSKRYAVKFIKTFFTTKDIKGARQRLDRLRQEEGVANTAQILEVVMAHTSGQAENMKKSIDGTQTPSLVIHGLLIYCSL
jgi:hypothetical protein